MNLYLIGIDWKRAGQDSREKVISKRKSIIDFCNRNFMQAPAIFSTCNRFEIYGASRDFIEARGNINSFLKHFPEFSRYGYTGDGVDSIFEHLLRVATGLESQLKGEPQVWEQLNSWSNQPGIPKLLVQLLREALSLAQDIRLRSGLYRKEFNIAALVLEDLKNNLGRDRDLKVIVVGTGKVACLFAAIKPKGIELYFSSRKNYLRANELAVSAGGCALAPKDLAGKLTETDALISVTSSPHFILKHIDFRLVAAGRQEPLYLYDLALPRDINPEVSRISNIVLKNLDSLYPVFQAHNKRIRETLDLAQYLAEEAVKERRGKYYEYNFESRNAAQSFSLKAG